MEKTNQQSKYQPESTPFCERALVREDLIEGFVVYARAMKGMDEPSMRIVKASNSTPGIAYRCPGPRGTTKERFLDRHEVLVEALPPGLEALVVTADLQGREMTSPHRLLGEAVAEELLCEGDPAHIGVLLAGDFYADENVDKLGSSGEVGGVWRAFSTEYRWTAGVLGNHDRLKESVEGTTLLDGDVVELDHLRIGGVSGIVGKAGRLLRRDLGTYLETLELVLASRPHILLLHESPAGDSPEFRGNHHITELLCRSQPTLVICGHCRWPYPLVTLDNGTQILNVDSRLCLLRQSTQVLR